MGRLRLAQSFDSRKKRFRYFLNLESELKCTSVDNRLIRNGLTLGGTDGDVGAHLGLPPIVDGLRKQRGMVSLHSVSPSSEERHGRVFRRSCLMDTEGEKAILRS